MSSMTENRSALRDFLASIATIRGDLSNITAPPFVLADKSAVEFPQYWAEHPSIFTAPTLESNPQKRALLVLKWFLSSLKSQQYAGRSPKDGVKKPLNAFLGELFLGEWTGETGTTRLISEQVSHHPPVTATYLWNDDCGIRAEGYTCQEITFNGSVNIKQIGHAILHIDKFDEDYLIPLPNVKVKGILTGSPYPELNGSYQIISTNGFTSDIDFSGKSFFSGTKNSLNAKLYRDSSSESPLYTVSGQWIDKFVFHDVESGTDIETYDANAQKAQPIKVGDRTQQDPWESRRAWGGVIDALHRGNMQATSDEKGKVEQAQRKMRKEEEKEGTKWKQTFFKTVKSDPIFEKLVAKTGVGLEVKRTKGIWKFDQDALGREKPYHGYLTPTGRTQQQNGNSREADRSDDVKVDHNGHEESSSNEQPPQASNGTGQPEDGRIQKFAVEQMLKDKYSSKKS